MKIDLTDFAELIAQEVFFKLKEFEAYIENKLAEKQGEEEQGEEEQGEEEEEKQGEEEQGEEKQGEEKQGEEEQGEEEQGENKIITDDCLRDAALKKAKELGSKTEISSLIKKYGCKKIVDLPQNKRKEFLTDIERVNKC